MARGNLRITLFRPSFETLTLSCLWQLVQERQSRIGGCMIGCRRKTPQCQRWTQHRGRNGHLLKRDLITVKVVINFQAKWQSSPINARARI